MPSGPAGVDPASGATLPWVPREADERKALRCRAHMPAIRFSVTMCAAHRSSHQKEGCVLTAGIRGPEVRTQPEGAHTGGAAAVEGDEGPWANVAGPGCKQRSDRPAAGRHHKQTHRTLPTLRRRRRPAGGEMDPPAHTSAEQAAQSGQRVLRADAEHRRLRGTSHAAGGVAIRVLWDHDPPVTGNVGGQVRDPAAFRDRQGWSVHCWPGYGRPAALVPGRG